MNRFLKQVIEPNKNKKGWPWDIESSGSLFQDATISFPKISVVTISYNQGQFIEETIRSVLLQNYPNLEYIVIDGGSTDESVEIIQKYSSFLNYWESVKDNGPANALNKGFSHANGELFYYLNSDDVLLPDTFFRVAQFISENPDFDFYYGHGFISEGTSLEKKYPAFSHKWNLNFYRLNSITIFQPSTFIRADIFKLCGGFNESNRTHWDGELLVDLAIKGARFKRFEFPAAIFRIYPESQSGGVGGTSALNKFYEARDKISQRVQEQYSFKNYPKIIIKIIQFATDPIVTTKRIIVKLKRI